MAGTRKQVGNRMSDSAGEVTHLLLACREGGKGALDALYPAVYSELRRVAHAKLQRERSGHTLNPTDLVHEAYFKLIDHCEVNWQNRSHFYAVASRAMRQVLVDYARNHTAKKRGGQEEDMSLADVGPVAVSQPDRLLELDRALQDLERMDPRQGEVVTCRFYAGYSIEETAEIMGVSISTVKRDWRTAKAWLTREVTS